MVKKNYTVSLDSEFAEELKSLFPNQFSTRLNEMIEQSLVAIRKDKNSINIKLERVLLEKEMKEQTKLYESIQIRKRMIEEYEKKKVEIKEEMLRKQKEELDQIVDCSRCGGVADRKYKEQPICTKCFMTL